MVFHFFSLSLVLLGTFPFRFFSYAMIHRFGNALGLVLYFLFPKYRKRALSNIALAKELNCSEEQLVRIAKQSLQNLVITCLEYAKFASEPLINRIATCKNKEIASQLMETGKGVIFFCGHLSNWEVLFLEGTQRMPGVAIGRPVKNLLLYRWILKIRQKYGGKIVAPKEAIKEGLKALRAGKFLGVVGDQGMPDSGYSSLFLGRRAWTSPLPALLSYRTGAPIIVATVKRVDHKYQIHYSDPILPQQELSMEGEIDRIMKASLAKLEKAIIEEPGQWLWSHNRWKQQVPGRLRKQFRHDSILIIFPEEKSKIAALLREQGVFREIYPREFLCFYVPKGIETQVLVEEAEVIPYQNPEDLLTRDFRFKLVLNLSLSRKVKRHFLKLAAFEVISESELEKAHSGGSFSQRLKSAALGVSQDAK